MIISIDIGTSYSSICYLDTDGKAKMIEIGTGISMYGNKYSIPSAVYLEEDGNVCIGQAAMNSRIIKPQNFKAEFKRDLGQDIPVYLGDKKYMPEDFYVIFFQHMKQCVEKKMPGETIEKTYITYPASYGKKKKEKLLDAASKAGLFQVELVDEPTSAAMCYCAQGLLKDGQNLLIYDFGGGTFDVSLLRYQNGRFQLLEEPDGLERCGGVDIDRIIFQDIMGIIDPGLMDMIRQRADYYQKFQCQILEMAIKAKEQLSSSDIYNDTVQVGFDALGYSLTREHFNYLIAKVLGDTVSLCRDMIDRAGLEGAEMPVILLVGGSSRIPLVKEMLQKVVCKEMILEIENPDLAVATGAIQLQTIRSAMENADKQETDEEKNLSDEMPEERKGNVSDEMPEESEDNVSDEISDNSQTDWAEEYYSMGCRYYKGEDFEKDIVKAVQWFDKAAGLGHPMAQFMLGRCLMYGEGIAKDEKQALEWYEKAGDNGVKDAQVILASWYENKNDEKSVYWYLKAAESGDANALFKVGNYYLQGNGVEKNEEKAVELWQKAAEQGHTEALYCIGKSFLSGTNSLPQNAERAVWFLNEAAKRGYPEAQYYLGQCKYDGYGCAKDYSEAYRWMKAAADHGHREAIYCEATYWENGIGVPKDINIARLRYQSAAEKGHAKAQEWSGIDAYRSADWTNALKWLQMAAEQNMHEAELYLGLCYDVGRGNLQADAVKAAALYKRSADSGYSEAQYHYAHCLAEGRGVQKDVKSAVELMAEAGESEVFAAEEWLAKYYSDETAGNIPEKALYWYEKMANQGNLAAQLETAMRYEAGVGTEANGCQAFIYYLKAAEQGDGPAQFKTAEYYRTQDGDIPDWKNAAPWYVKAADRQIEGAFYYVGHCSFYGLGLEKNYEKALEFYQKAEAIRENADSYELGKCLRMFWWKNDGYMDQAMAYFKKAAEQGIAAAEQDFNDCRYHYSKLGGSEAIGRRACEFLRNNQRLGNWTFDAKLKQALNYPVQAEILYAHNDTWIAIGSRIGYIITDQGIYCKPKRQGGTYHVSWEQFVKGTISKTSGIELALDGTPLCIHAGSARQYYLDQLFYELQDYMRQ